MAVSTGRKRESLVWDFFDYDSPKAESVCKIILFVRWLSAVALKLILQCIWHMHMSCCDNLWQFAVGQMTEIQTTHFSRLKLKLWLKLTSSTKIK